MGVSLVARLLLGALFICAGGVKISRIGQAVAPDVHKEMAKDFGRYLRVAPFKSYIKCNSLQYMQVVGFTELICGFLLLTSKFTGIVCFVLIGIMAGAIYTLYRLKDPMQMIAFPFVVMLVAIYVAFNHDHHHHDRKEKKE